MSTAHEPNGATAPTEDKPEPTIIERVHAAALEGVEANVRRWLEFQGHELGDVIEIQSLGVRDGNFKNNYFVHAFDAETAVRLAVEADGYADAEGLYFIAHKPDPAIAARGVVGARARMMKDEGTSNADIRERCVLYIDVDAKRPKGISATTEHMDRAQYVASIIYADIASVLGDEDPLGFGHSGNGAAVLVALGHLPETPEVESTIRAIVAACAELYDMPKGRLPVQIDPSVCDAKRLLPCWGTVKRKGVANETRPHRRTGLVCSGDVRGIGMDELLALRDALVARFGPNIPKKVRDALGKAAAVAVAGKDDSPWTRARALPPRDVAKWLGVLDETGGVTCPGCKRHGPPCMIKILDFGFRCGSGTCATKGKKGFRDNVDLTAEVREVERWEALKLLAAEFGFSASSAVSDAGGAPAVAPDLAGVCQAMPALFKRLPTGIEAIDRNAGGDITAWTTSRVVIIGGAPGANKTSLIAALGWNWAQHGVTVEDIKHDVAVCYFATDEPRHGFLSRFGQIEGQRRADLDSEDLTRAEPAWSAVKTLLAETPNLSIFDPRFDRVTLEDVAEYLDRQPLERRVLFVDSLHSAPFRADRGEKDMRLKIDGRMRSLVDLGTKYRICIVITSELNRGAYRSKQAGDLQEDIAAFKESSGIEYGADFALVLRSVKGQGSLVDGSVCKNRIGTTDVRFRLERGPRLAFRSVDCPNAVDADKAKEDQKDQKLDALKKAIVAKLA